MGGLGSAGAAGDWPSAGSTDEVVHRSRLVVRKGVMALEVASGRDLVGGWDGRAGVQVVLAVSKGLVQGFIYF